ncbi:site-specific DNA-methyltransferase [Luteolibacter sp. SL250]|uniref:site-specific DNA-methyltransferase n=1 Tax=Luteolibacter sp. SL250 TaxID=2995170 RepID=UPI00226DD246|nr:site-specific DNA-methyltransferase [Luteolibacter sp. SL250]WAC20902.1 site-specific DNA-methyltransferase [Luteolibacter sp. SL250]
MKQSLIIEYVPIWALKVHGSNPRKHSKKQLRQIADSIKTFGFKVPVLIDQNNRLICGHGRVEACRLLGIETVPAIRAVDLDEAKIRAYMIADNRLTENGGWDDILLGENFKFLADLELDFSLEITGFDYGDIEQFIIEEEGSTSGEPPIPDAEDLPAIAHPGDLWLMDKHRLFCGDSLAEESYRRLFEDQSKATIVFTDPPYNLPAREIGKTCAANHGAFAMGSGEMSSADFTDFLATVFAHLKKNSSDGSIHYICMDWRHAGELLAAGGRVYDEYKNLCVWTKTTGGMGTFYRSQHELIFVFKSGKGKHQNHFKLGEHGRYRTNVWKHPSVMHLKSADGDKSGKEALGLHPTIKPVGLVEDALRDCSRQGEIVLDAFLGSGSTLIAAEKTGRVCFGIEMSPRYVDVAIKRWQEWTGMDAVHARTGAKYDEINREQAL